MTIKKHKANDKHVSHAPQKHTANDKHKPCIQRQEHLANETRGLIK